MKDQHRGKIDIEGDKRHMSPYKYQANKFMEPFTEKGKGDKRNVQSGRRDYYPTSLRKSGQLLVSVL